MRMLLAAIFPVRSMPSSYMHPSAGTQVCGQPFRQAGDVEEDIPSAIVGTQEAEALGFEIGHHAPVCSPEGASPVGIAGFRSRRWAGLLVLSPTPCLTRARSASVQSAGG